MPAKFSGESPNLSHEDVESVGETATEEMLEGPNGYKIPYAESVPDGANTIIIATHGFCGDKKSSCISLLEENVNQVGAGLVKFDWPAHGDSPVEGDQLTVANCLADLDAVVKHVREKYPNAKLVPFSTSFGGYVTLLYIQEHPNDFAHVILRSPAINMYDVLSDSIMDDAARESVREKGSFRFGFERPIDVTDRFVEELKQNNVQEALRGMPLSNVTIIHGTSDDLVPFSDSQDFATQHGAHIYPVTGADHRYKGDGELAKVMFVALNVLKNLDSSDGSAPLND
ncbi:alpha/beta fold hydrolase [Candidatus Saccharibacteria bacterium]|nr:alpha/beta fold hydrolase [Candidatus Saccharibacteria bacterium]